MVPNTMLKFWKLYPIGSYTCPTSATPVRTRESGRSRAVRPQKHNPANSHCFLTQRPLNPEASRTNVLEETQYTWRPCQWFGISGTIICFSTRLWHNTPPGCVRSIWPIWIVMKCCIRWPGLHYHTTSTQLRWFGMSWTAEWRISSQ